MKPLFKYSLAATLYLSASAAVADVTAAEVWAQAKTWMENNGAGALSHGAVLENGGEITISDIVLTMDQMQLDGPQTEMNMVIDYGTMSFRENGDGTVDVTYADVMPASIMVNDRGEKVTIGFELRNAGQKTTVSGTPERMIYDMSLASSTIALTELSVPNDEVAGAASITLSGIKANYAMSDGDLIDLTYDMSVDQVSINADFKNPEGAENVLISGGMQSLSASGDMLMPKGLDYSDPTLNPFAFGMKMDAKYAYEDGEMRVEFSDGGSQNMITMQGSSSAEVVFDKDHMRMQLASADLAMTVLGPIPVPVEFGATELAMTLAMPFGKELAEYELGMRLVDVSVSDFIWSMVDPLEKLGRDPITAIFNVSGLGKWHFDLMDPEQAAMMERADVPGEVHSLNLNELVVDAAGANLVGDGAFVFDNNDLQTIPGVPRPEGKLEVTLSGGNALMDTLVEMGLLSMDQVMPVRMMSGMFAEVVGDDVLRSVIEVNSQGHVSANGQRLR